MALEGCASCLKYLMIIWNFVILILGIAITGIGVWMVVDKDSGKFVDEFVEDDRFIISYSRVSDPGVFETLAYILIVFGAITVVIAFLGYCGAMRESQCLLGACFALLFIIFSALVGIGIYLYIKKDDMDVDREKLRPVVGEMLRDAVDNYFKDEASKNFMDAVQTKYQCCGADKGGGGLRSNLDYTGHLYHRISQSLPGPLLRTCGVDHRCKAVFQRKNDHRYGCSPGCGWCFDPGHDLDADPVLLCATKW
eukprot:GHVL01004297.1.p1 GENE.GHVL01004297.1~~GHVL01004297.1.p1  ORF type:complete len:252 (+),score=4.29 GHVL01004297.1:124-879(+)